MTLVLPPFSDSSLSALRGVCFRISNLRALLKRSMLNSTLLFLLYIVRVCFVDVEGQGDRDVTYDARLASAILPLTKCVIFNWRDSLQVDRILNLLGVMQRAAHNVDLGKSLLQTSLVLIGLLLIGMSNRFFVIISSLSLLYRSSAFRSSYYIQ